MRVLTWHIHGSYLYSLVQAREHDFFLPVREGRPHGYGGRAGPFPWPDNVHEVNVDDVPSRPFDVVLSQSRGNWLEDRERILSVAQRRLPRIHIEHDPPRETPTDTLHFVDDPGALVVHVTHFNALMWDAGRTPTTVIEHGVAVPDELRWSGEHERGIVVVNGLKHRGRRLGLDVFDRVRVRVPLDLAGMQSDELGGLGDLPLEELWRREVRYRFFFNPIRYTSLGLAVCEAMMLGMPIVGLATTEMATVIRSGASGYIDTDVERLIGHCRRLLEDRREAQMLGEGARRVAKERFDIRRFARDWDTVLRLVTGARRPRAIRSARMPSPRRRARGEDH